jgi:hypothetical protein
MSDLEAQIRQWRAELVRLGIAMEVVDELEAHLRERVDRLSVALPPAEAFAKAARELGDGKTLKREFSRNGGLLLFWRKNPLALNLVGGWLVLMGLDCFLQAADLYNSPPAFFPKTWVSSMMLFFLFMGQQVAVGARLLRHGRFWWFAALGFLVLNGYFSAWNLIEYVRAAGYVSLHADYTFLGIPISLRFRCVTDVLILGMALFGLYVLSRPDTRDRFRPALAR